MSGNNFWNEDEGEFRDMPDEVYNQPAPPVVLPQQPNNRVVRQPVQAVESYEDYVDEVASENEEDENEDYSEVLSDARLRLEQGRLYEMIMNNNIFEDVNADAKAVKHVQREIRKFAKERMEIMLGMRKEAPKIEAPQVVMPFNELEIGLLKQLAHKMSNGKTAEPQANKYAEVINVAKKDTITPIKAPAPQAAPKLNAISQPKVSATPANTAAPLAKPVAPVAKRGRKPKTQAASAPATDDNYKPLEKPVSEMTTDELLARNQEAASRQVGRKQAKSNAALPQPTFEQEQMLYTQRALDAAPAVSAIVNLINNQKK